MRVLICSIFFCAALSVQLIHADDILAANVSAISTGNIYYGNTLYHMSEGRNFHTTNEAYTVRYLGYYDHGGDGLAVPFEVYIWDHETHALLASALIPSGTNAPLYAGFRWSKLNTPVVLPANTNFIVTSLSITTDPYLHTLDGKDMVSIAEVAGSDIVSIGTEVWVYGVTWGSSATSPGMMATFLDEVPFGPNLASRIDIFDPARSSLSIATQDVQNCYAIRLDDPSPFYDYSLVYTTNLLSGSWQPVQPANLLLSASNFIWAVSSDWTRCYFKAVTNSL
ncbi:MAG: hypothetical protein EOM20_12445 [Spartobacteria bacterium]|nr:hypothetical protein [Spartobacteria bacterium]